MAFNENIFINCPFDEDYKPILKALVFCTIYLGYKPLLSETLNSANSRMEGIQNLISKAKYSIHDLSRMEATKKNELARFNMPFELGIDMGCKRFGKGKYKDKFLLIFDKIRHRYKKALSDLSGNDIEIHNNSPEIAIRKFRNWMYRIQKTKVKMDSGNKIWERYNEFNGDFYQISKDNELSRYDIDEMPWDEFCQYILDWKEGHANFKS